MLFPLRMLFFFQEKETLRIFVFMICWLFVVPCLFSQTSGNDPLEKNTKGPIPDTGLIASYIKLAEEEFKRPDDDRDLGKMREWLEKSIALAEHAEHQVKKSEALFWFSRYYESLDSLELSLATLVAAAETMERSGKIGKAADYYAEVLKSLDWYGYTERWPIYTERIFSLEEDLRQQKVFAPLFYAYYYQGLTLKHHNQLDSSNLFFEEAVALSKETKVDFYLPYMEWGYNLMAVGDFTAAVMLSQAFMDRAQKEADPLAEVWAWSFCGSLFSQLDPTQARKAFLQAEQLAKRLNYSDFERLFAASRMMQEAWLDHKDFSLDSLEYLYQKSIEANPCNLYFEELGEIYCRRGELDKAVSFFSELIRKGEACNNPYYVVSMKIRKAKVLMQMGRYGEAQPLVDTALDDALEYEDGTLVINAKSLKGRLAIAAGKYEEGEKLVSEGFAHYDSLNLNSLRSVGKLAAQIVEEEARKEVREKENALLRAELDKKQLYQIILALLLASVLILIGLNYDRRRIQSQIRYFTAELTGYLHELRNMIKADMDFLSESLQGAIAESELELKEMESAIGKPNQSPRQQLAQLQKIIDHQSEIKQLVLATVTKKEEQLRSFNFSISHDLKTPLNNARHLLQRWKAGSVVLKQEGEQVELMEGLLDEMSSMIDGVAAFSRADHSQLDIIELKPGDLLKSVLRQWKEAQSELDVSVVKIEEPLPVIQADPLLLRQVFHNLLSNALKFTREEKEPLIRVWAERREGFSVIRIADNGVGIAPELIPRVFELFSTAHDREKYSGAGVGLSIVRRIMERLGGWVDLYSEGVGKGSRVDLYFPA
ncbi:MAG: ATP-binding protein [bacterium]|nr:ATP-binding protein [bacterium]